MVERYRLPLTRYCARMVGADNADDIVQDTFTASYSALGSGDRPIQLKPWLYRVAHNTAISALRKRSRHEHEELDENFDGVRQPHDHLEQSQRLHDLVANMRALPERQRAAIVLQELEGMSPEEIADELDGSVPMVRQLVHRARERLRNGVGMLIPLPLLLKLFRADKAAAATAKPAGAAVAAGKPAAIAGIGLTGSSAKLAVAVTVGLIAGGGVAVERVVLSSGAGGSGKAAVAQASAADADSVAAAQVPSAGPRAGTQSKNGTSAGPGTSDGTAPAAAGEGGNDADTGRSAPDAREGAGGQETESPAGGEVTDPSGGDRAGTQPAPSEGGSPASGGDQPSSGGTEPAAGGESTPAAGGGSQPSGDGGGGSQPAGGGSGGGSTGGDPPPAGGGGGSGGSGGGGSTPSCKPLLGIPLPLICL